MTIADRLLKKMIQYNIIDKEDAEIYRFGLEGLTLKLFHYSTYLLIAFFLGEVSQFIMFFMAFLLLRKNAGGYHAKTKVGCYLLSCMTIMGAILIGKYVQEINLTELLMGIGIISLVIADIVIGCLAPLGNRNRILNDREIKYYKKKTRIVLGIENIIVFLLVMNQLESYAIPIYLAILIQMIILLIEKMRIIF